MLCQVEIALTDPTLALPMTVFTESQDPWRARDRMGPWPRVLLACQ